MGANLRDCSHASLIWIGRNQTRLLSLIPVAQVNSGTRTAVIVLMPAGSGAFRHDLAIAGRSVALAATQNG